MNSYIILQFVDYVCTFIVMIKWFLKLGKW